MGHTPLPHPFQVWFVFRRVGLAILSACIVCISPPVIGKAVQIVENRSGMGLLGVAQLVSWSLTSLFSTETKELHKIIGNARVVSSLL